MRTIVISDNRDTLVGMRLAGVSGVIVHERNEILRELDLALEDQDIGIIIMTELIMEQVKEEVLQLKIKRNHPLIIEIPDRHGSRRGDDAITRYIKESIGIQI